MTTSQDQEQQLELETRSAEETTAFLDEIETEFDPEVALEKEQQDKAQKQNEIDAKQMALEATQESILYRLGSLLFEGVLNINGILNQNDIQPTIDLDGSKDYGTIDYFEKNQSYFKVEGGFGNIEFESSGVHFKLRT
jgi:hypothetical protein